MSGNRITCVSAVGTFFLGAAALTAEERKTFREAKRLYMYSEFMKSGKDVDELSRRIIQEREARRDMTDARRRERGS